MDTAASPRLRTKLLFWLLLGVLSVALAEVTVASSPLAFVSPADGAFLVVFYGSHLLVFAWLAFRGGWPSLSALWFAGVLFGLYEFYITKVLWAPPWGGSISIGQVDVFAFIVLALFWHPFMAFIVPLAVAEDRGTTSRWVVSQIPKRVGNFLWRWGVWIVVFGAAIHGLLTGSPVVAVASMLSAIIAVALVLRWWRRDGRNERWTLRGLLPNDRQGLGVALLLAAQYALFIPTWEPERMPPLVNHPLVWVLYAGFALLLWLALRQPLAAGSGQIESRRIGRLTIAATGGLVGASALASLGPQNLASIAVWLMATVVGLAMLVASVRHVLRDPHRVPSR